MKTNASKKLHMALGGAAIGVINGLLGAGGGMIAVPLLKSQGLSQRKAHAASVMIIFFLSIFSAAVYLFEGRVSVTSAAVYIPGGIAGAVLGALLLGRISDNLLRRIFGIFMIYTGIRLFFR